MAVEALQGQVREAFEHSSPLLIRGGNSKSFLGQPDAGQSVATSQLDQVLSYEPAELVVRVQAGVSIRYLRELLAAEGQMLGFEPPAFDAAATIGGTLASGMSGSRRVYAGAARDFVLGVGLLDGTGQVHNFGGQVMKNVAGFDVARLVAGARGQLGVITDVSLRLLPLPESELTLVKPVPMTDLLSACQALQRLPETSATAWQAGQLHVRFSGSEKAVARRRAEFGGEQGDPGFWTRVDEFRVFDQEQGINIVTCAPDDPVALEAADLVDWGGCRRWLTGERDEQLAGLGRNLRWLGGDGQAWFQRPVVAQQSLERRLKAVFDPRGILNPGLPGGID